MTDTRFKYWGERLRALYKTVTSSAFNEFELADVEAYLPLLEQYFVKLSDEHCALAMMPGSSEDLNSAHAMYERLYIQIRGRLSTKRSQLVEQPMNQSSAAASVPPALDIAILGCFNGETTAWRSYSQKFVEKVHQCTAMSPNQKMRYLIETTSGKATQINGQFIDNPNAYEVAWKRLCDYFNDSYMQVRTWLQELNDIRRLRTASAVGLSQIKEKVSNIIAQIRALGNGTDADGYMFMHAIAALFDCDTLRQWDVFRRRNAPTL